MCARQPVNARLDPEFAETLADEAEALGRSRSEYIRAILHRRERILPLDDLDDAEHESINARVERLERAVFGPNTADSDGVAGPDTGDYDIVADATTTDHADVAGPATTDHGGQGTTALDWRAQLAADLDAMGVENESHRENVEALAEFLKENGYLSRKEVVEAEEVVTAWEWDKCKDWLAGSSVVHRADQRTWSWVGADG